MWVFGKRSSKARRDITSSRRLARPESLEPRVLLAANPVHVGLVYIETDYLSGIDKGTDTLPDRFLLSFSGGAPDTELTEIKISTDRDGDGLSAGDLVFDTMPGYRGAGESHPFQVVSINSADPRATVTGIVEDGEQLLTLQLTHFRAGDTVEFTLDVDEVQRWFEGISLDFLNSRIDVIASGAEFQDSILTATLKAPHYETIVSQDIFNDFYTDPTQYGLNLPPDFSNDPNSLPNRTAAAFAHAQQIPKPISISGSVFVDDNLNLIKEPGEALLRDVRIELWMLDSATGNYVNTGHSTRTDASGAYKFGTELGLMPGTYRVIETQPSGYFSVGSIPGTVDGNTVGQAVTADILNEISIPLGDLHAVNYDFAEARPAEVSGYVYRDDSDDGIRNSGEIGIGGVRIRLIPITTISAQSELTTTTASDGSYRFAGLAPGSYRIVEVDQPAPYTDGLDRAGTIGGVQVGAAVNPGDQINGIQLIGGSRGIEYNFGELPLGSLSGYVFLPPPGEDCDSVTIGDAIPLAGVQIRLYDSVDRLVAETTTAADGSYRFNNVPKGTYRIVETTPPGLIDGEPHVGTIDGIVVGTETLDGALSNIILPAGRNGVHYDFCEAAPAKVSGYVYHDSSNDGIRDATENGIGGATVRLIDDSGNVVATTQTNASGYYEFVDLMPGSYRIDEVTPAGYLDGLDTAGKVAGTTVGSAINPGDSIRGLVLKQGQSGIEYNFGELRPASIAGRVHVDLDDDCIQDANEQSLEGVVIRLLDSSGQEIARTQTNAQGEYRFDGLRPGQYTVVEEQPAGYFQGGQVAGSTGGNITVVDQIRFIPVSSGQNSVENNFCENPPSDLRGIVYADRDEDCVRDAGEPAIAGVKIELLDENGNVISTTTTDAQGRYEFTGLRKGRYTVRETQPVGYLQGGQVAGSGGGDASQQDVISKIDIGWGQNLINYDFCEIEPSSISGKVYVDSDGDCVHEPELGERTLAGVTVHLHDSTGRIIATTLTDANGKYSFQNLRPGSYRVSEIQPAGYFQGGQVVGSGGGRVLADDLIGEILIGANQNLINYDFCEIEPSTLSGKVYVDNDRDCVYEPELGENPLEGVIIRLHDEAGNIVATTTTDALGMYHFANLRPGKYRVSEIQPAGYYQGGQVVGSGGGVILADDLIGDIQIGPGQNLIDYDFCEVEPSSLSGKVFVDNDGDCIYEPEDGEGPLAGVTIRLHDEAGNIVATTTTDALGRYRFDDLPPGKYRVNEVQPAGYYQGGQMVGSGGGVILGDDLIGDIDINPGQNLINYDFCEVTGSTLAGRVWSDINLNSKFDNDEQPLAGVRIDLFNSVGQLVATTTTNDAGDYLFTDLAPGTYSVHEYQPSGYFHGGQIAGSHGGEARLEDIISSIVVPGSATLVRYDFPEVPPATISGYVFQDGSAIKLRNAPPAEQLRSYQDGQLTSDDTRLAGVVLELHNLLGDAFTGQEALPGVYADGPIRVTTDANGYYEFTGLRPRATYHVYQVQPDGYIDGLDTPGGGTGGKAVNVADLPNDPELQVIVQTLALAAFDPGTDAILSLFVSPGQHAGFNNFSEIIIEPPTPGPPQDPPGWNPPETITPPVDVFPTPQRPFLGWAPHPLNPMPWYTWTADVSWHLSVINGGQPRGAGVDPALIFQPASNEDLMQRWQPDKANRGQWQFFNADGELVENNRLFVMGTNTAIPMVGDFDGDGRDETALYVDGEWLIDLNGNGRWDAGDLWVKLGSPSDRPVVGDWDGDGKDDVGIFGPEWSRDPVAIPRDPGLPDPDNQLRKAKKNTPPQDEDATSGQRLLRKTARGSMRADLIDHVFRYGESADIPLVGDWNGDGIDTIAVFRDGAWKLDSNGDGRWSTEDVTCVFGQVGDIPMVADWNGDGIDELIVVRGDVWIVDIDGDRKITAADLHLRIARQPDEIPVIGDWDGDGRAEPGYYRYTPEEPEAA